MVDEVVEEEEFDYVAAEEERRKTKMQGMGNLALLARMEREAADRYEARLRSLVFDLRYPWLQFSQYEKDEDGWVPEATGASWAEISEALGCTRQAAQQRFGRWVKERLDEAHEEFTNALIREHEAEMRQ